MLEFLGYWLLVVIVAAILFAVFLGRPAGRYDDEMGIGEDTHHD